MGSFAFNIQAAAGNINRNAQPRFRGNENTPIQEELSEQTLVDILLQYKKNPQVQEMAGILAGQRWCITAGFHEGGLGGAAGGADPRPHITLSTGHHLRFNKDRNKLIEITGQGISASQGRPLAPADTAVGSPQWWMNEYGLTNKQALKAVRVAKTSQLTKAQIARDIQA